MTDPAPTSLVDVVTIQSEQITQLRGVAESLSKQVELDVRSRERTRRIYLVIAAILLPILIGVGVLVIRLNVLANSNQALQQQNAELLQEVRDCTSPNGKCAQRGNSAVEMAVQRVVAQLTQEIQQDIALLKDDLKKGQ